MLKPSLSDVLREPSHEAFAGYLGDHNSKQGKFVRMGGVILVAPLIDLEPPESTPYHFNMIKAGLHHPDQELTDKFTLASRAKTGGKYLSELYALADAGHYLVRVQEESLITGILVHGQSTEYGRADAAGRERTASIMRDYLERTAIIVTPR